MEKQGGGGISNVCVLQISKNTHIFVLAVSENHSQ
jgi:hypothetical protein